MRENMRKRVDEGGKKGEKNQCQEKEAGCKGVHVFRQYRFLKNLFLQQLHLRSLSAQLLLKTQITNVVRGAGRFSRPGQKFSTWPRLANKEDLKLIHPGVSGCVEECIRFQSTAAMLKFVLISECLQAFYYLLHLASSAYDSNYRRCVRNVSLLDYARIQLCCFHFIFFLESKMFPFSIFIGLLIFLIKTIVSDKKYWLI